MDELSKWFKTNNAAVAVGMADLGLAVGHVQDAEADPQGVHARDPDPVVTRAVRARAEVRAVARARAVVEASHQSTREVTAVVNHLVSEVPHQSTITNPKAAVDHDPNQPPPIRMIRHGV